MTDEQRRVYIEESDFSFKCEAKSSKQHKNIIRLFWNSKWYNTKHHFGEIILILFTCILCDINSYAYCISTIFVSHITPEKKVV